MKMMRREALAQNRPLRSFIDLGSGDGVVVLAAAAAGLQATGIEVSISLNLSHFLTHYVPKVESVACHAVQMACVPGRYVEERAVFVLQPVGSGSVQVRCRYDFRSTSYYAKVCRVLELLSQLNTLYSKRFAAKVEAEAPDKTFVFLNRFEIPGWKVHAQEDEVKLYVLDKANRTHRQETNAL